MSKEQPKRFLQMNHALSGYHGEDLRTKAIQIYETRKDLLKRLERKKRLAVVINDELYSYLEKFPEEKMGLHQESFKKKKARLLQADEKIVYQTPSYQFNFESSFASDPKQELTRFSFLFAHPLLEGNSSEN